MVPFIPFFSYYKGNEQVLTKANNLICKLMYIDYVLITVPLFALINAAITPLAYIFNSLRLFTSIFYQPTFTSRLKRLVLTLKFIVGALLFLPFCLIIDVVAFTINLWSIPKKDLINDPNFHLKQSRRQRKIGSNVIKNVYNELKAAHDKDRNATNSNG